ncbi:hypothetical protein [Speluncibacter jeojiensis]|uniref:Uncharacterized protein n=1 Tax=Speluncibacter jeojiensis TaxID=2710754 RepID=A0A9X4RCI6_9ACTN|nr:hypothetical protein [Corynebacteriales bacterium D3-21]
MDEPDTLTAALVADAIRKSHTNIAEISKATGLARTTLADRLTASSSFKVRELAQIAETLQLRLRDLIPDDAA